MIKKLSLFFARQIRERIQSEAGFKSSPGLLSAIAFPTNLMRATMYTLLPDEEAKIIGDAAWKYFDGTHAESNDVRDAFRKAQRVEGIVSLQYGGAVGLELSFYKKGDKRAFFVIGPVFNRDGKIEVVSDSRR